MIDLFTGKYRFLSNFFPRRVRYKGLSYRTAEHAYQCAKTEDVLDRQEIRRAETPGQAKRLGKKIVLREYWDDVKIEVMREIVTSKFTEDDDLREDLLATGDQELVEGNTWGDTFWGVYKGEGENHLGHILMEVRELLR